MSLKRNILFTKDTTQEYLVKDWKSMNQNNALVDYLQFSALLTYPDWRRRNSLLRGRVCRSGFALSAFSGRRDEQFTSKLQTVSTVPSVTRHKTEMNRNWMAPPLCRKSQKAQGVCIVASRAGRCWNLSSHGGGWGDSRTQVLQGEEMVTQAETGLLKSHNTISSISWSRSYLGTQPSFSLALLASPRRKSTSVGR